MPVSKPIRFLGAALFVTLALLAFGQYAARAQTPPDPEKLEEGARLFAENCAVCHGQNGQGRVGATLAKDWPSVRPDLTVKTTIENGIPGSVMPAWSEKNGGPLNNEQIDALVTYILSWQTGGVPSIITLPTATAHPPITPVASVEGDPNQGAVLFGENCAVCHGPNGEGRVGATLQKDWPSIRPDLSIKTTIENGIPGSVMPAWSQENGGPLTGEQINHLVAFVLSQPAMGQVEPQSPPVPPFQASWLAGWGGVLLFFVLFVVIVAAAMIMQRKST